MAVNIDGSEAEIRVATLNIRADRVQTDLGAGGAQQLRSNRNLVDLGGQIAVVPGGGGNGGGARGGGRAARAPVAPIQKSNFPLRCCHGMMLVPFAISLSLLVLSVATFVVKNEEALQYCNFTCSLTCSNSFLPSSMKVSCYVAYGTGGMSSIFAAIFILTLTVKACSGFKL